MSRNISFFEARKVCQQTHVSWVGPEPVTWRQRPAAFVTSRPVLSISQSVGTTTRVVDAKKTVAPVKLSPLNKSVNSSKPSSPKQQVSPVHESDTYFTIIRNQGKSKESSTVTLLVSLSPKLSKSLLF